MLDSKNLRDSAATGNPTGALKRVNFKTIRKFTILAFCGAYLLVQAFCIIRAHFHVDIARFPVISFRRKGPIFGT